MIFTGQRNSFPAQPDLAKPDLLLPEKHYAKSDLLLPEKHYAKSDLLWPEKALRKNAILCRMKKKLNFANNSTRSDCLYYGRIMIHDKLEKKISNLKNGDGNAFDYIYDHTHRAVYFTIFYIVKDKMYAEDILQDTFVRAISFIDEYREGTNFIGWICSIGKSLALNHLKKYRREIPTDFDADAYKYGSNEPELPYIFDVAAKILSEDEYKIVMLCQVAGYKRREVSAMLGIPLGTVTWKNNEALKKLRNHLEKEDRL